MFNTCQQCGECHDDKQVDPSGPYAVCPTCGYRHRFVSLPLFCVTGPSGTGKSAVCAHLAPRTPEAVVLDSDILWCQEFNSPDTDWREYRNLWLRVCKNVAQAGRPVLLCGSTNPGQFEACAEARYFTGIHYLALVCDDEVLATRLRQRPAWRASDSDSFIQEHQKWCHWFRATQHEQDVTLLDTSGQSLEETAGAVREWVIGRLSTAR